MKRGEFLTTFLGVALAVALAACGGSGAAPSAPSASTSAASSASSPSATSRAATSAAATLASASSSAGAYGSSSAVTSSATSVSSGAATSSAAVPPGPRTYVIVPDLSKATYQVRERIFELPGPTVAEGRTSAIKGSVTVDVQKPLEAKFSDLVVDISTLQSDKLRRDNYIRTHFLESSKYPNAEFTSVKVESGPATYTPGQEATYKLTGLMKIHDTQKPLSFDTRVKLAGDTLTGAATTDFNMTDFGVQPPEVAGMLKAENGVHLVINFTAKS